MSIPHSRKSSIELPDVDQLLSRHPAAILTWLDGWLKEGKMVSLDSEINWLGLAEIAAAHASNMYGRRSILESLLWGSVAIIVGEQLAKSEPKGNDLLHGAMVVRSNLILRLGSHPGDPICDAKIIVDWFYQTLSMSLQEAETLVKAWHSHPAGRKYELKMIVERLKIIRDLAAHQCLHPDSDLERWLRLLPDATETRIDLEGP